MDINREERQDAENSCLARGIMKTKQEFMNVVRVDIWTVGM